MSDEYPPFLGTRPGVIATMWRKGDIRSYIVPARFVTLSQLALDRVHALGDLSAEWPQLENGKHDQYITIGCAVRNGHGEINSWIPPYPLLNEYPVFFAREGKQQRDETWHLPQSWEHVHCGTAWDVNRVATRRAFCIEFESKLGGPFNG